ATSLAVKMRPFQGAMLWVFTPGRILMTYVSLSGDSKDVAMSMLIAPLNPLGYTSRSVTASVQFPPTVSWVSFWATLYVDVTGIVDVPPFTNLRLLTGTSGLGTPCERLMFFGAPPPLPDDEPVLVVPPLDLLLHPSSAAAARPVPLSAMPRR